jgi:hypothetical protein
MGPGDFVELHVDRHSDPDIRAAVVFQLAAAEKGGEFFSVPPAGDGQPVLLQATAGQVVVSRGDVPHFVSAVDAGTRVSLCCFIGHAAE